MNRVFSAKLICFFITLFACTACVLGIWGTKLSRYSSPQFYRNPQAIYDHFFGSFHLSEEVREQLFVELEMIVNALVLKEKQGENVAALAVVTGEIAEHRLQSKEIQQEIAQIKQSLRAYHHRIGTGSESFHRSLRTAEVAAYAGQCTPFAEYITQQSDLVTRYGLPHTIASRTTQVMDVNGNHFLKDIQDPDLFGDAVALANSERARTDRYNQLRSYPWLNGDIVFGHRKQCTGESAIQGYWNHVGIYSSACNCLIDVWYSDATSGTGGIRYSDFAFWAESFDNIGVLRLSATSEAQRSIATTFATRHLGEPYNLTTYKLNPSGGWYCSKLIYQAFLQAGVDLDSGHGVAIFPDDIAVSQGLDALHCL